MLNVVNLVGRIATDVELRYSGKGNPICYFAVAVAKPYYAQTEDADASFPRVVVFGKLAEIVAEYKKKGDLIAVAGWLNTRSYETDDGVRYVTEVVAEDVRFLDYRERDEEDEKDKRKTTKTKTKRR